MSSSPHPHPSDATLTVTRAAEVLGVHSNTVRAWSDAGRIRYYRINPRGDRRYRRSDLNRFLSAAVAGAPEAAAQGRGFRSQRGRTAGSSVFGAADTGAAVRVLSGLGRIAASVISTPADAEALLGSATRIIREGLGFRHVSVWRLDDDRLEPAAVSGPAGLRLSSVRADAGLFGRALGRTGQVVDDQGLVNAELPLGVTGRRLACTIPGHSGSWGALLGVAAGDEPASPSTTELLVGATELLGSIIGSADAAAAADRRMHYAEALGRVAGDISSRLDPDELLSRLLEHAMTMFDGDRAAVFLITADGSRRAVVSRGLSFAYLESVREGGPWALPGEAGSESRPRFTVRVRDDPRVADARASIVQEGYDTVCVAPLMRDGTADPIGSLTIYHDQPHPWSSDELDALADLAAQASAALRSSQTYAQLATWTAQLQSIQQLGARLNRLSDVAAIGEAIATELKQLIDYHNVRVYRQVGEDLIPVAMLGEVGEYIDQTPEQLRTTVGQGITGWVAAHRVAQYLPDADADPRTNTIAGTDDAMDESMLLAPMLFEDAVLGVLVLSKLGLNQFTDDDLRLLVIYASFAAQAMAHADATERLHRQIQSRRDLLAITESILGTLDTRSVLESVADRLGELVRSDNLWIMLRDDGSDALTTVVATGVDSTTYVEPMADEWKSLTGWVLERNEAALVADQYDDERVYVLTSGRRHGGLICVPLRGRGRAIGTLSVERLGLAQSFSGEEFELVQLFAAHVSIALQNARAHGEIARQAETDDLTGLRNHRSFRQALSASVASGSPFSLLMVDLDHFKLVNDTFGHEAGNDFLQNVGRAIAQASRDSDTAFRYGGDEFAVLLSGTDADHAGLVAERIRSAIARIGASTPELASKGIAVDASAGVATFPDDGVSPDEILLAADRACFVAKRGGGGRVATAAEGAALVSEFTLQIPTPIDESD
ncbi:MAG: GAF domain-containing protein [Chloroflexota bacterium]